MITPHFNAIKARIETDAALTGKVFDTVRIDEAGGLVRDNYVILYRSSPDRIESERFNAVAGSESSLFFVAEVRAVGTSAQSCGAVMDKVETQLVGHALSVLGRSCTPIRKGTSDKAKADPSVKPFLYYMDCEFEFVSRPA